MWVVLASVKQAAIKVQRCKLLTLLVHYARITRICSESNSQLCCLSLSKVTAAVWFRASEYCSFVAAADFISKALRKRRKTGLMSLRRLR
jgi:hypothetical protein